jgi:hypothetical protein
LPLPPLLAVRLRNQRLRGARSGTARDVVHWLAALQAQEFHLAKWSVAQRARGATLADIDQAFAGGVIVRTHLLRPTWHFVLGADIRWLLQVTGPRVHALNAYYYGQHELDKKLLAKSNAVIAKSLEGGAHLTRRELAGALARSGLRVSGNRLAYVVMRAELDGIVCSGAMRGKQHTYALLETRVAPAQALAPDAALAELTTRYFTSRGPATLSDFVTWSSLTAKEGREGLALVGNALESDVLDGKTFWFGAGTSSPRKSAPPIADLVQAYDEIVMSYSDSRDDSFRVGRGPFYHAVLMDGRLVGHWRPVAKGTAVRIDMALNRALARPETKALDRAIDAYGRFLGVRLTIALRRRK